MNSLLTPNVAVRLLIDTGADTNARGGEWVTPLIAAAFKQRDDILQLLIENGADLNTESQKKGSALSQAAKAGNAPLVATLIRAGANANGSASSPQAPTPLYSGAKSGSLATVQILLKHGADVNKRGSGTNTFNDYTYPLIVTANKWHIQIVRVLLTAGANPNAKGRRSCTALEESITSRDMAIFRAVLDAGADPNMCSESYTNCLHKSIRCHEYAMAKVLMKAGGTLEATMLINAVEIHRDEPWFLEALLEPDSINVDIFAEYSGSTVTTALHVAAEAHEIVTTSQAGRQVKKKGLHSGNDTAMRLLLDRGAYVDPISQQSYMTPLCQALCRGNIHLAKILIEYGADVNHTTTHSPLELAVMYAHEEGGSWEAFEMLLDREADIHHNTEKV
jgi:ankyrin repeat protein